MAAVLGVGVTKGLVSLVGLPALAALPQASCSYDSSYGFSRGHALGRASSREMRRGGTRLSASRLEMTACKSRLRKRRRGKGSDGDSDSDDFGGGGGWSSFGGGGGGQGDFGGYSGGGGWDEGLYEAGWLWPMLVAIAVVHSVNVGVREFTAGPARSSLRSYTVSSGGRTLRS
ncbi:hypothetical protein TSOC_010851 [Tetrabaena socialis]|uniref:Uncharacterized protein n=1 Tax=Tetrabaena socialis TaxID=47790 RepID=A0A2J7ZS63_9CHLO|nr:hypothetical protein TSOC_010851 [Tetrabaena socialis]|eukprot:PNH03112.1 hypothetical protein TSOC_010851 [Tetrabaena socialis]